jgi:glycolate oxidase
MEIEKNSLNKITEICKSSGSSKIILPETEEEADQLYSARATAYLAVRQLASGIHIEDVVVPIDKLSDYLLTVKNIASKYNLTIPLLGHAGDGNVHPNILYDKSDPVSVENASHAFEDICKYAIDVGGSITGEHGIGIQKMKLFKDQILSHNGVDVLYLMKSIKKLFDPQGLLNPGKYVEVED